jgi:hypothetical protein
VQTSVRAKGVDIETSLNTLRKLTDAGISAVTKGDWRRYLALWEKIKECVIKRKALFLLYIGLFYQKQIMSVWRLGYSKSLAYILS